MNNPVRIAARQVETARGEPQAGVIPVSNLPDDVGINLRRLLSGSLTHDIFAGAVLGRIDWVVRVSGDGPDRTLEIPASNPSEEAKAVAAFLTATLPKVPFKEALRIVD
jgi:hypothetical protein